MTGANFNMPSNAFTGRGPIDLPVYMPGVNFNTPSNGFTSWISLQNYNGVNQYYNGVNQYPYQKNIRSERQD